MTWTQQQGLETSFNIHAGINSADPQFATANATAGGLTPDPTRGGGDYEFDWSNPNQLAAYFNLHQPFEQQGVREWWLDYCWCGNSTASDPHVAPDNFINQEYAQDGTARGLRGFSFGRIGSLGAGRRQRQLRARAVVRAAQHRCSSPATPRPPGT